MNLPIDFVKRMDSLLGQEAPAFFASFGRPAVKGLRVNTLKISTIDFLTIAQWPLTPIAWSREGFVLAEQEAKRPGRDAYHAAGLYYLQDPSAMAAVTLLDPRPGEMILDLCAAPGGKATAIAARLGHQGLLVANEIVRSRAAALVENLERFGTRQMIVTNAPPHLVAAQWSGFFDGVLVDAPCSGESLFRKSPAATLEWHPAGAEGCAIRQKGILDDAAKAVRPGGRLLYATCTFAPQENEAVIAHFLSHHPEFQLITGPHQLGFSPGRSDWLAAGTADGLPLEGCVRIWPHLAEGEGHFMALLQRVDEGPTPLATRSVPTKGKIQPPPAIHPALQTFWQEQFNTDPPPSLAQLGLDFYQLPVAPSFWGKLRPMRVGVQLGQLTGREQHHFIPAHALALAADPATMKHKVNFPAGAAEITAYLRGETLICPGQDGWLVVTVDGFPLGWGKRVQGLLKNHYPHQLRHP